jgi:hypothetical protein
MPRFGWVSDLPDVRDHYFRVGAEKVLTFPPVVDLRGIMPPIQDQGDLGSCTAHAVSASHEYAQILQNQKYFSPCGFSCITTRGYYRALRGMTLVPHYVTPLRRWLDTAHVQRNCGHMISRSLQDVLLSL